MALLQVLIDDHDIPKRMRKAAQHTKKTLAEKHAKRLTEEAAAKEAAAQGVGGAAPATP